MKILIVSTSDFKGGAAKCAYRIGKYLKGKNHEVLLYVLNKSLDENWILESGRSKLSKMLTHFSDRALGVLFSMDKSIPFTLGVFGEKLDKIIEDFKPDIINFHWTGKGFVSFKEIVKQSQSYKSVWTLHDWNAFSDGSFFKLENLDILDSLPGNILSNWNLDRKKKLSRGKSFNVVVPSIFLSELVSKSDIFSTSNINIINNGIDLDTYKKNNKAESREYLDLDPSSKYILFGASDIKKDRAKGFDLLVDSIHKMKSWLEEENIGLVSFGSTDPFLEAGLSDIKVNKKFLGYITDEDKMSKIYSSADVLLFTSRIENYPFIVIECLASGTPVVAFSVGGIPEIIDSEELGITVEPFNTTKIAEAVKEILQRKSFDISDSILKKYSIERCAEQYLELFSRIKI
jgi:glycosyltransferase involved in cell wall biosynthesis